MTGAWGGLAGGGGANHRALTPCAGGRRANYGCFGYVQGHPGDGHVANPPTYQMTRQVGHDLSPVKTTLYRSSRHDWHETAKQTLPRTNSLPLVGGGFSKPAPFRAPQGQAYHELHVKRLMAADAAHIAMVIFVKEALADVALADMQGCGKVEETLALARKRRRTARPGRSILLWFLRLQR
eukprot:CAMPEP_0170261854 /NCGR_PEP_ID=MMETSP0116_2-20130129/30809_1 /TAXON_ID=400756 /ORGANISM="Durinskia baltica, Strain CSIRO CS-38" /LENGTH=180 /DNA_ID=CAMNT_0010512921 /DNA_START=65 /DNA_END=603 /DNA_ORIENTATION=-